MIAKAVLSAFYKAAENHNSDEEWLSKKEEAYIKNKWFVVENINQCLDQWLESLKPENADRWLGMYNWPEQFHTKKLGLIMAGNIPLVGMHDLITGLCAGYIVHVKTASDDEVLPKFWVKKAIEIMPELQNRVVFTDSMKGIDCAIATGSNSSAKYFEYYFRHIPNVLRKNRNSAAVLDGNETEENLVALGHDVFDYFGLGCRNVTHVLLPEGFDLVRIFQAWEVFSEVKNHNKYANNYSYHQALLLMNLDKHLDNGFILLKESETLYSPIGMMNYHFYKSKDEVKTWLAENADQIQCVTSLNPEFSNLKLGEAQKAMLWDYADGVDTAEWLCWNG